MRVIKSATDLTKVSFADLADSTITRIFKSVCHFYVAIIEKMLRNFSIVADDEIEHLLEEFQEYQLSPDDDLPAVTSESRVDTFWAEMGRKKTFVVAVRFPLLTRVMTTLSVIAHSSADSKRLFSMVRKIDTDSRSQLGSDTLRAVLSCKINTDDSCYAFVLDEHLCKAAKVATWKYVWEHQ